MIKRLPASRIALIAILAIVWHALMPLAHAMSARQGVLSSICATSGSAPRVELIQLPADQQGVPAVDPVKLCPLCASGAHVTIYGEPALAFVPHAALAHVQTSTSSSAAVHVAPWLHFSSRAPPQA